MEHEYDLLVIGAGSAGVRCSRMAAARGWKVAVVENRYLGGTCVNVGCVPKKLFVYASEYPTRFEEARGFGVRGMVEGFDWSTLRDNKTNEINRLNNVYKSLLENSGVTIVQGGARLEGPHQVRVGERIIRAERIVIATGGWPVKPDIPGAEYGITSNEAFYLDTFPQRVVVVGGGYIAVEFAGIFNGLGAETHLLYRGEQILRGFDAGVRDFAATQIAHKGIHIHTRTDVTRIERNADGSLTCHLTQGEPLQCDTLMFATGRQPLTAGIGLEQAGVRLRDDGSIIVDHLFRTDAPGIYALGDVIGTPALTPVALAQAMKLLAHWFDGNNEPLSYDNIPTAVFCQPNIATVGLTEEQALTRFGVNDVRIFETSFRPMKHTLSGMPERTFMKLVVQISTDKVLGAHMVGEEAGEIIQGIAIAIKAGATKTQFDSTIGIHPTAAEEFVTLRTPRG